jgi:hypothetical protein
LLAAGILAFSLIILINVAILTFALSIHLTTPVLAIGCKGGPTEPVVAVVAHALSEVFQMSVRTLRDRTRFTATGSVWCWALDCSIFLLDLEFFVSPLNFFLTFNDDLALGLCDMRFLVHYFSEFIGCGAFFSCSKRSSFFLKASVVV